MKKFLSILLFVCVVIPSTRAFRDIPSHSKIYPAIQKLIDRGVLKDGTFFRPENYVPAKMFWEIVLRDAEFNPESATFGTPLPPNIDENDPLAQFLREAIRRGFIDSEKNFDKERFITRIEAIELLVKLKGIRINRRVSNVFRRKISGVSKNAKYLPAVEAAYASKFLKDIDIRPLKPKSLLTRRNLIEWIDRYNDHGEKKSTLNPRTREVKRSTSNLRKLKRSTQEQIKKIKNTTVYIKPKNGRFSTRKNNSIIPNNQIFEGVFRAIESKYRFPEKLTPKKKEKMIDAAIAAMVEEIGDKYSSYIEPEKSQNFSSGLNGKFEGIGAYVELIEKKFTITAPIKGSPAEKAGLMAGDIVTHVNDESIDGYSVTKSVNLIKGPAGTKVKLTILRDKKIHNITVTRGKITIPSITLKWEKSVPIIGIHKFTNQTDHDFSKILKNEVLPKNPHGIVLDLRNNPGGFLTSAVAMGEFFLDKGDLIFSVETKNSKQAYKSSRRGELYGYPNIVVLQNKGTASASEILGAMLQEYGIAKIIGTKSVGKGSVQEISNFSNGSMLKLTIAKWLTPKGKWIQEDKDESKHGVIPDIEIADQTLEERNQKIDRQLDAAVREILNN